MKASLIVTSCADIDVMSHFCSISEGNGFQTSCIMFTWKLWGFPSMSWMQVFSLDLWTFHNTRQLCDTLVAKHVWGFNTSCCSVWLLSWPQRFLADLRGFLHPAGERLLMGPPLHCLQKTDRNVAFIANMSSGLMAIRIVIAHDCSHCVNQHSSSNCLTRAAIPQAKWLYCPQCTRKPRWRTCVWVCLFFGPYPELLYLPRPSLCRLSSSSSSLSDQISFWPFCRQTWRISTVITAHSRKHSCTKWSDSCQISWCLR